MCNWFSFISFNGKFYYFSQKQIEEITKDGNKERLEFDSHASIAKYFLHKNEKEDKSNKYEYHYFEDKFIVDQINDSLDDRKEAEDWVNKLFKKEFKYVIPAKKEIDRIRNIKWFSPIVPNEKKLQIRANLIAKAFGLDFSVNLEVNKLDTGAAWSAAESAARSAAWSAAESATRSAAWSAARSAAWSAAESAARSAAESAAWSAAESAAESADFETVADLLKEKYPKNPFKLIMDLWEEGYYVCGLVDKKFIVYYIPKKGD